MQTQNQPQTVKSVFQQKFTNYLAKTPLKKPLALVVISYAIAWPESALDAAHAVLVAKSYFLPKVLFAAVLIYRWRYVRKIAKSLHNKKKCKQNIEGIPATELIDHLFEFESFKRTDVLGKFGIPANRFENIAKKLEELGLLVRGDNNSRILAPGTSREKIAEALGESDGSAETIKVPIKIFHFGNPLRRKVKIKHQKMLFPRGPAIINLREPEKD